MNGDRGKRRACASRSREIDAHREIATSARPPARRDGSARVGRMSRRLQARAKRNATVHAANGAPRFGLS